MCKHCCAYNWKKPRQYILGTQVSHNKSIVNFCFRHSHESETPWKTNSRGSSTLYPAPQLTRFSFFVTLLSLVTALETVTTVTSPQVFCWNVPSDSEGMTDTPYTAYDPFSLLISYKRTLGVSGHLRSVPRVSAYGRYGCTFNRYC